MITVPTSKIRVYWRGYNTAKVANINITLLSYINASLYLSSMTTHPYIISLVQQNDFMQLSCEWFSISVLVQYKSVSCSVTLASKYTDNKHIDCVGI